MNIKEMLQAALVEVTKNIKEEKNKKPYKPTKQKLMKLENESEEYLKAFYTLDLFGHGNDSPSSQNPYVVFRNAIGMTDDYIERIEEEGREKVIESAMLGAAKTLQKNRTNHSWEWLFGYITENEYQSYRLQHMLDPKKYDRTFIIIPDAIQEQIEKVQLQAFRTLIIVMLNGTEENNWEKELSKVRVELLVNIKQVYPEFQHSYRIEQEVEWYFKKKIKDKKVTEEDRKMYEKIGYLFLERFRAEREIYSEVTNLNNIIFISEQLSILISKEEQELLTQEMMEYIQTKIIDGTGSREEIENKEIQETLLEILA